MSQKEQYESRAEELILPILSANSCELVDVEYIKEAGDWYLRIYADKEGGITVDDCETISRAFSDVLDEKDFIRDAYILEVSSPGLLRPLKKERDYVRNAGKPIEIRTYKAVDTRKEFVGILDSWDQNTVTIIPENEDGITIDRKNISLIRQYVEF